MLALRGGRLEQVADRTEETQGRHDQGGWSQSRYQRHIDNLDLEHYKAVADELERLFRALGRPRIIVVAGDETRAEFAEVLSTRGRGRRHRLDDAPTRTRPTRSSREVVQPLSMSGAPSAEAEAVERWREEVGKDARGTSGWAETLEAASDGRVELLLHQAGVQRDAYRCPACGRAAADAATARSTARRWRPRRRARPRRPADARVRRRPARRRERRDLDPVEGSARFCVSSNA